MKKMILVLLISCAAHMLPAQVLKDSLPPNMSKGRAISSMYLRKSETLIPLGYILVGTGVAGFAIGLNGFLNNLDLLHNNHKEDGYAVLTLLGVGAFAAGVPLLARGYVLKRRAVLLLRTENKASLWHIPVSSKGVSLGIAIVL